MSINYGFWAFVVAWSIVITAGLILASIILFAAKKIVRWRQRRLDKLNRKRR